MPYIKLEDLSDTWRYAPLASIAMESLVTSIVNAPRYESIPCEKKEKTHPELWSDEDIDYFAEIVYKSCEGKDCDACPDRLEIDGQTCKSDVLSDLWRKWKNAVM